MSYEPTPKTIPVKSSSEKKKSIQTRFDRYRSFRETNENSEKSYKVDKVGNISKSCQRTGHQ